MMPFGASKGSGQPISMLSMLSNHLIKETIFSDSAELSDLDG